MNENNDIVNVAFIGNPNCGKTSLFNDYTGAKLKVANWPGVTVEKKEGAFRFHNCEYKLVDLPGIYSLTSYTMEERLSRQYILEDEVDVIVDVADASSLERNLYLTLQLIELGKPVVLALNMMDIVQERGMEIDTHRLPEMLGIPCIPVSARKKTGLDVLMHTVAHHKDKSHVENLEHHHHNQCQSKHKHNHHRDCVMVYSDEIEDKIDAIEDILREKYPDMVNYRWHALKFLDQDAEIMERYPIDVSGIADRSYEKDLINEKYDFIAEIVEECLMNKEKKAESTDRIDKLLTHPILGLPIFLVIMAFVFFLTFAVGDSLKGVFEIGLGWFSETVTALLAEAGASDWIVSLVVDGIIAGVGGILTFLPNIFMLFLSLAFMEDSGYMSRVAYVMDGIMGKLGLSGRAFIPMILGFGCSVPAIMASRALEDPKDRMKTILVTPFMSCSARLPIYVIFAGMFFPENSLLVAYSMYLIGLAVAILIALVLNIIDKQKNVHALLIELPEYKAPNARSIAVYVWEKIKDYLSKAGTTIFIASIIIWFILNLGPNGFVTDMSQSFGAMAGHFVSPLLAPAGLNQWQIVVALIAGIAAKEIVVSSMGILYGIHNVNSVAGMTGLSAGLTAAGFGALNAYCMMVFCLLYIPCAATIGTIRKETNSWKWTIFAVVFQLGIAYLMATVIFQVGSMF